MHLKSLLVAFTTLTSTSVLAAPTDIDTSIEAGPVCLASKKQICPGVRTNWQGGGSTTRIVGAIARIRAAAKDVPLVPYLGLSLMISALQDSGLANALVLCVELVARMCGFLLVQCSLWLRTDYTSVFDK